MENETRRRLRGCGTKGRFSDSLRDHTNHRHPHLQTFSKFEVPNHITTEHIKPFNKSYYMPGVGAGVVCVYIVVLNRWTLEFHTPLFQSPLSILAKIID